MAKSRGDRVFEAAQEGDTEKIKNLINQGILVHEPDASKLAFLVAAQNGHVTVLKLLLDAGINPNATVSDKRTALHVAASSNHTEAVELLLKYNTDVNLHDIIDCTSIDYATHQPIIDLLLKAGATPRNIQKQAKLIKNYNYFVDEFNENKIFKLPHVNKKGLCHGLGVEFISYAKKNRLPEFQFFLTFLNSLSKNDIQQLVLKYIENEKLHVQLKDDNSISYSFKALIDFMNLVNVAYQNQSMHPYKSINADWDEVYLFVCPISELAQQLKEHAIMQCRNDNTGEFKCLSSGSHLTTLYNTKNDGSYFYDSEQAEAFKLIKNEDELAKQITISIARKDSMKEGMIGFFVDDISYRTGNSEFDNIIEKYSAIIRNRTDLQSLVLRYQNGCISSRDCAFILHRKIKQLSRTIHDFNSLKDELKEYLDNHPSSTVFIPPDDADENPQYFGASPIHVACRSGSLGLVQRLIHGKLFHDEDINTKNDSGEAPLLIAAAQDHLEIVQCLLNAGADTNIVKKSNGLTPIGAAAAQGHNNVVKLLLANGANPNLTTVQGKSPLCLAVRNGYTEVAKLLLINGADLNLPDKKGLTPLGYAVHYGHSEIVKLLLFQNNNLDDIVVNMYRAQDKKSNKNQSANDTYQTIVSLLKLRHNLEKISPKMNAEPYYQLYSLFYADKTAAAASALKEVIYGTGNPDLLTPYKDIFETTLKKIYNQCAILYPEKLTIKLTESAIHTKKSSNSPNSPNSNSF